ncbi:MAG TPA: ArsA-related P-loop ATPase, partial [Ilumatobacter sp.]
RFLQDIAEFFILFQAMEPGFVAHAREVEQVLVDPRTTFVVVSTLEAAPTHEATYLARALRARDMHLGAIIANRVLPAGITSKASATSARKLAALDSGTVQRVAVALDADPAVVDGVLREVATQFHDTAMVATRESERRAELAALAPLLVSIPLLAGDANDVADLLEIAEHFDT